MFDEATFNKLAHKIADIIIAKMDDKPSIQPKYVSFKDAGIILGNMSVNAIREMVKAGKLRSFRKGDRLWIKISDIDAMMVPEQ
jgi:hypothetical protein